MGSEFLSRLRGKRRVLVLQVCVPVYGRAIETKEVDTLHRRIDATDGALCVGAPFRCCCEDVPLFERLAVVTPLRIS